MNFCFSVSVFGMKITNPFYMLPIFCSASMAIRIFLCLAKFIF